MGGVHQRVEFVPPFVRHVIWVGNHLSPEREIHADLTPAQACEVAGMLMQVAAMVERAEGLSGTARRDVEVNVGSAMIVPFAQGGTVR